MTLRTIPEIKDKYYKVNHLNSQFLPYIADERKDNTFDFNNRFKKFLSFTKDPSYSLEFVLSAMNRKCLLPKESDHFYLYKIRHQVLLFFINPKNKSMNELDNKLPSILDRLGSLGLQSSVIKKIKSNNSYSRLKDKTPDIVEIHSFNKFIIYDLAISTNYSETLKQKRKYQEISDLINNNHMICDFILLHSKTQVSMTDLENMERHIEFLAPKEVILNVMNLLLNSINTIRKNISGMSKLRSLHNKFMKKNNNEEDFFRFPEVEIFDEDYKYDPYYFPEYKNFRCITSDDLDDVKKTYLDFYPKNVNDQVMKEFRDLTNFGKGTASVNHDPHDLNHELSDAITSSGYFSGYNTPCITPSDNNFLTCVKNSFVEFHNNRVDDMSPYSRKGEDLRTLNENINKFYDRNKGQDRIGHDLPMMGLFPVFEYEDEYHLDYSLEKEIKSFSLSCDLSEKNKRSSMQMEYLSKSVSNHRDFEFSIDNTTSCQYFLERQHYNKKEKYRDELNRSKLSGDTNKEDNFLNYNNKMYDKNKGYSMNYSTYMRHKDSYEKLSKIMMKKIKNRENRETGLNLNFNTINENFLNDRVTKSIKSLSSTNSAFATYIYQMISQEISLNCEKPIRKGTIKIIKTHVHGTFALLLPSGSILNDKTRVTIAIIYKKSKRRIGESLRLGPDKFELNDDYYITSGLTIDRFRTEHYLRIFDQYLSVLKSLQTTMGKMNNSHNPEFEFEEGMIEGKHDDVNTEEEKVDSDYDEDEEENDSPKITFDINTTDAPFLMCMTMINHKRSETDFLMESRYVIVQCLTNSSISSATFLDRMDQPIRSLNHYHLIDRIVKFMKSMNTTNLSDMINIGDLRSNLLDESLDSDYSGASFRCTSCFFNYIDKSENLIVGFDQIISEMYLGVTFNKNSGNASQDSIKICKKLLKSEFSFDKVSRQISDDIDVNYHLIKEIFTNANRLFNTNLKLSEILDYYRKNYYKGFIYPKELVRKRSEILINDVSPRHTAKYNEFIDSRDLCDTMTFVLNSLSKKQHVFSARSLNVFSKLNIVHKSNPLGKEMYENCLKRENLLRDLSEYATFKSSVVDREPKKVKHLGKKDIRDDKLKDMKTLEMKYPSVMNEEEINSYNREVRSIHRKYKRLAMKGYDSREITDRKKCFENISDIIKTDECKNNEELAEKKIRNYKLLVEMFRKNQLGGPREILILTMTGRVLINIIEKTAINLTKFDSREMLTSGSIKEESFFRTTSLRNTNFKSNNISVDFYTEDKSKWCQNFMPMCFYYCYLPYLHAKNSKYFFYKVLFAHHNKIVYFPDELLKKIDRLSKLKRTHPERVYFQSQHPNISKIINNYSKTSLPFVKNTSNMMQGVLHYSSTFLHCISVTMRDYLHNHFVETVRSSDSELYDNFGEMSSKDYNEIQSYHDEQINTLVTSDDSFDCVIYPGRPQQIKYRKFYEEIRKCHNESIEISKVLSWRNCSMIENPKKSVKSSFGEFNSTFRLLNSHGCPIIKFLLRNCDLFDSDSPANFIESAYQASMNFRLIGGSAENSLFTHYLNKKFMNDMFDVDNMISDNAEIENIHNFMPYDFANYPIDSLGILDFLGPKYFNYRIIENLRMIDSGQELEPIEDKVEDLEKESKMRSESGLVNSDFYLDMNDFEEDELETLTIFYMNLYSNNKSAISDDYVDSSLLKKTSLLSSLRKSIILERKQANLPMSKDQILSYYFEKPQYILSKNDTFTQSLSKSILTSYTLGAEKSMRVRSPILFFKRYTGSKTGKYMYSSNDGDVRKLRNIKTIIIEMSKLKDEKDKKSDFFERFKYYFSEESFYREMIFQDSYIVEEDDYITISDVRARKPVKSEIYRNEKDLFNDVSTIINCRWHQIGESDESIDMDFQCLKLKFPWLKDSLSSTMEFLKVDNNKENVFSIHKLLDVLCYKSNRKVFKYLSNGSDNYGVADFVRNIITWNIVPYEKLRKPGEKFMKRFNFVRTIRLFIEILVNSFQYILSSDDPEKIDEFLSKIRIPIAFENNSIKLSNSNSLNWQKFYDEFSEIINKIKLTKIQIKIFNQILVYMTQNEYNSVGPGNLNFIRTNWVKEQSFSNGFWKGSFELNMKSTRHSVNVKAKNSNTSTWIITASTSDVRLLGPFFKELGKMFPSFLTSKVSSEDRLNEYRNSMKPEFKVSKKQKNRRKLSGDKLDKFLKKTKNNFLNKEVGMIRSIDFINEKVLSNGKRIHLLISDKSTIPISGENKFEIYCTEYFEGGLRKQTISLVRKSVNDIKKRLKFLKSRSNRSMNLKRSSMLEMAKLNKNIKKLKIKEIKQSSYLRNKFKEIHKNISRNETEDVDILSTTKINFQVSKFFPSKISEIFPDFRLNGLNVPYMFYMGKMNNFTGKIDLGLAEFRKLIDNEQHCIKLRWSEIQCLYFMNYLTEYEPVIQTNNGKKSIVEYFYDERYEGMSYFELLSMILELDFGIELTIQPVKSPSEKRIVNNLMELVEGNKENKNGIYDFPSGSLVKAYTTLRSIESDYYPKSETSEKSYKKMTSKDSYIINTTGFRNYYQDLPMETLEEDNVVEEKRETREVSDLIIPVRKRVLVTRSEKILNSYYSKRFFQRIFCSCFFKKGIKKMDDRIVVDVSFSNIDYSFKKINSINMLWYVISEELENVERVTKNLSEARLHNKRNFLPPIELMDEKLEKYFLDKPDKPKRRRMMRRKKSQQRRTFGMSNKN